LLINMSLVLRFLEYIYHLQGICWILHNVTILFIYSRWLLVTALQVCLLLSCWCRKSLRPELIHWAFNTPHWIRYRSLARLTKPRTFLVIFYCIRWILYLQYDTLSFSPLRHHFRFLLIVEVSHIFLLIQVKSEDKCGALALLGNEVKMTSISLYYLLGNEQPET